MLKATYPNRKSKVKKANVEYTFEEEREDSNSPIFDVPSVSFEDKMVSLLANVIGNDNKHQKLLAVVLMAAAGLFLTLGNSLVQYVYTLNSGIKISSFEVLFVRSIIQLFFSIIFMAYGKVHPYGGNKRNLPVLCLMGVVEAAAIVLIYLSLERIPVGDSTVIQFTAPIFTMIFSFAITQKCCGWVDAVFGMISFVGVVFIAKPSIIEGKDNTVYFHQHHNFHNSINSTTSLQITPTSPHYVVGATFALLAAVCLSWFYILNKMNGKKTDVMLTIFYPSIFGIIIAPIFMAIKGDHVVITEMNGLSWGLLCVVGFVAFIGLMFMAEALQLEHAGPAVLIRNMDVIYAFIFQLIFMHHTPGLSALIGTVVVLTCSSVIAINRICQMEKSCRQNASKEEEGSDAEYPLLEKPTDEEN